MDIKTERKEWSRKVGQVFNTMPRDGNTRETVWLSREKIENRYADLLSFPGVHVCLDGPTGTGKSSLAVTGLHALKYKYILVQIRKSMKWQEFCRKFITQPTITDSTLATEINAGIEGLIPKGNIQFSLGTNRNVSDKLEIVDKMAEEWTEDNVCEFMVKNDVSLLIDDFEQASENIINRIATMCKLLTQSYVNPLSKLIIVGTDDIYRRLFLANPSLEERLEEISVGTLPTAAASWKFLQMGFEKLRLAHPANDKYVTKEENIECMRAIYEAADGLPKSLNVLGRDISINGMGRKRISPSDIKEFSLKMPERGLAKYRQEFSQIIKTVEHNAAIRIVLKHLFELGIGQIHHWGEITSSLSSQIPDKQIDSAIKELVKINLLTQTGRYGDILFVTDPNFCHTLGVVIENPEKYGQKADKYSPLGQLTLPFDIEE